LVEAMQLAFVVGGPLRQHADADLLHAVAGDERIDQHLAGALDARPVLSREARPDPRHVLAGRNAARRLERLDRVALPIDSLARGGEPGVIGKWHDYSMTPRVRAWTAKRRVEAREAAGYAQCGSLSYRLHAVPGVRRDQGHREAYNPV